MGRAKVKKLEGQLGAATKRVNELERTILESEQKLREARRQLSNPEDRLAQIENLALTPEDQVREKLDSNQVILISVDGINAAGKDTLLETLNYALTAVGVPYIALKESRDLDPLVEDKRREKLRVGDRKLREQVIGGYVTLGRILGLPELYRRLREGRGLVMLNRYYPTTLAYQVGVSEVDINTAIGRIARSYLLPHASIILLCEPEEARKRETNINRTGRTSDSLGDLEMRARGFCEIAEHIPRGYVIDITKKTPEETAVEVVEKLIVPNLEKNQVYGGVSTSTILEKVRERYNTAGTGNGAV